MSDATGFPGKSGPDEKRREEPVLDSLKTEGQRIANEVRDRAEALATDQKNEGAAYVRDLAAAIDAMSQSLESTGHAGTATYTATAAQRLQRLGRDFEAKEFGALARDFDDLARRHPALFLGGALVAGFGLARFIRSSARDDDDMTRPLEANPTGSTTAEDRTNG